MAVKRFCTKIGCKIKQNEVLKEYFKDKIKEAEDRPKNKREWIWHKIKNDLIDLVK